MDAPKKTDSLAMLLGTKTEINRKFRKLSTILPLFWFWQSVFTAELVLFLIPTQQKPRSRLLLLEA